MAMAVCGLLLLLESLRGADCYSCRRLCALLFGSGEAAPAPAGVASGFTEAGSVNPSGSAPLIDAAARRSSYDSLVAAGPDDRENDCDCADDDDHASASLLGKRTLLAHPRSYR